MTALLIRLLQCALANLTLPPGVQPVVVTTRMPANGWQAMPFITVLLHIIRQTEVEIGEDVPNPQPDNTWTLWVDAQRIWRITIMSPAAEERDFYRDTLLAVFRILAATVFSPLGYNVAHAFQAQSFTSAEEWDGHIPGFYGADLTFEINGIFPTTITTDYPVVKAVESNMTFDTDTFTVIVGHV